MAEFELRPTSASRSPIGDGEESYERGISKYPSQGGSIAQASPGSLDAYDNDTKWEMYILNQLQNVKEEQDISFLEFNQQNMIYREM